MKNVPYHEAIGSLMWACLGTRPDIAFAVTMLSCFSKDPGEVHWIAVKRVLRYLKGMRDLQLSFGRGAQDLVGYADTDGSMAEDWCAISGYAFLLDGGAVSWACKKQEIVSLSMTESEYIVATHAAKEALWLRSLLSQIFASYHMKHIDVRFHFIRWVITDGKLKLIYCPTDDMVADTLTKALLSAKTKHFAIELGLRMA
jgi:hypothetical protein